MFKKTLLALALASTTSAFAASTISLDGTNAGLQVAISTQGLPATKAVKILPAANAAAVEAFTATTTSTDYIKIGLKEADDAVVKSGAFLVVNVTGAFFSNTCKRIRWCC
jgi:hypothetical protein